VNNAYDSPGKLLANFYLSPTAQLVLLSGPSGCGKTTWCIQLQRIATRQNIPVHGIVSPAVIKDGVKVGINLLPLPGGRPRRLAVRRQNETSGLYTDDWLFDEHQMDWGERYLARINSPQLLIMDELGPLEFFNGQGWQSAFSLIDKRAYHLAIIVVRPILLDIARKRWPWAETLVLPPLEAIDEAWLEHNDPD